MIHVPNRMSSFEMFAMSPTAMLQLCKMDDATRYKSAGQPDTLKLIDRKREKREKNPRIS